MSVIKKPVITEKYTDLGERLNKYAFIVDKRATKPQIRKEVEELYNVSIVDIRTMIYPGKTKVRYTKRNFISGRTQSFKKAVVTVKEGDTIDFYSSI